MYRMTDYTVPKHLDRAVAIGQYYHDNYYGVHALTDKIQPFWQMNMSVALLYAITGEEAVRTSIGLIGEYNRQTWLPYLDNAVYGSTPPLFLAENFAPPTYFGSGENLG